MEMIGQNPGASAETKWKRKRKRDRSGDKKKTNLVSQNASAMDEIEMISQTADDSCGNKGKMKRCTKLNHGRSGDKKNSSPKPNLEEMVSESGAGTSDEKKNSPKPKLKYTEKRNPNKMEMIGQNPGASAETKRKRKRDRSGDKKKSSSPKTITQNASAMDEMKMISQTAGASFGNKGKMKKCTTLNHDRSSDKKKSSSPKQNLGEMVSQNAGAFGEEKNSSQKPNLMDEMEMINQNAGASCEKIRKRRKRISTVKMEPAWHNSPPKPKLASGEEKNYSPRPCLIPNKEDLESDATVMALYERWCCFWKRNRTPEDMKERFKFFKGRAIRCYERNVSKGRCAFQLFRFSDFTPEESYRHPICAAGSPPSAEQMRRIREMYQEKSDRSGDKKKTNLVSQNASAMDEMEMISQTADASCGNKRKMKRCTKLNRGQPSILFPHLLLFAF